MKNRHQTNTSEIRGEQVTNTPQSIQATDTDTASTAQYEVIYLGADLHKDSVVVTRIIDQASPQPAQRLTWEGFWRFVQKQTTLAKKVYVVYEAGAFGFWACRKLKGLGVECY